MTETHGFGGDWTEEKLKRVEKYLKAYATIRLAGRTLVYKLTW